MPVACQPIVPDGLVQEAITRAFANAGNCVFRDYGDAGAVTANDPVDMTVLVGTVSGFVSRTVFKVATQTQTEEITAPTGGSSGDLRRIDLVQYTLNQGINIKTGDEDVSPTAPTADSNSIVLAHIYCRNGMTNIKDSDDSSNGYIVDARVYA